MSDEIRPASSVIVARESAAGLEVLVVERAGASRFLPGYLAFPGGSTDHGDAVLAERWFGTVAEAARAGAVRELLEEVGLALTARGLVEADGRSADLLDRSPPTPERLPEIARWVAPARVPVRFDARYFAIEAPPGLRAVPDGAETTDAWWATPRQLLEDWHEHRRKLYWPTYFTLEAISRCASVSELLDLRLETREPHPGELERLPRSTFWQDLA